MGLISKYRTRLLIGRIFVYRHGHNWCIGKIVEASTSNEIVYKPLGRSEDLVADPNSFAVTSYMDDMSELIESSSHFEKYLELFDGVD